MKLILLGYMGSGKTGVGRLLAKKLELPFLDLDQEITKAEGRDIPEIFKDSGEIYFRKKETEILKSILENGPDAFILSTGGGTPCYGKNLQLMKSAEAAHPIYLKTSLDALTRRLFLEKDSRPLISHLASEGALNDFIRKHLFERTYYYNQSELVVETDLRSPKEVAEEIIKKLVLKDVRPVSGGGLSE